MDGSLFSDYIHWRAEHPSDDLMTDLLNAEFDDENGVRRTLTHEEILTYVSVVAGAGNETTARLIGWMIGLLDQHPDQRADLVADASLLPGAIEETLRFEPTGHAVARYVTTDVEYYGQTVPGRQRHHLHRRVGQPRRTALGGRRNASTSAARSPST